MGYLYQEDRAPRNDDDAWREEALRNFFSAFLFFEGFGKPFASVPSAGTCAL